MARGIAAPAQGKDERIEVLSTQPIREIDMSTKPVGLAADKDERAMLDPMSVAPVVRSAVRQRDDEESVEETVKTRRYRVLADKPIVDPTSGSRTKLREGKEISSAHYNIRDLQRQGVKLQDITDLADDAPIPTI